MSKRGREESAERLRRGKSQDAFSTVHSHPRANFLSPDPVLTSLERAPSLSRLHAQSSTETSGLGETVTSGFSSQESVHSHFGDDRGTNLWERSRRRGGNSPGGGRGDGLAKRQNPALPNSFLTLEAGPQVSPPVEHLPPDSDKSTSRRPRDSGGRSLTPQQAREELQERQRRQQQRHRDRRSPRRPEPSERKEESRVRPSSAGSYAEADPRRTEADPRRTETDPRRRLRSSSGSRESSTAEADKEHDRSFVVVGRAKTNSKEGAVPHSSARLDSRTNSKEGAVPHSSARLDSRTNSKEGAVPHSSARLDSRTNSKEGAATNFVLSSRTNSRDGKGLNAPRASSKDRTSSHTRSKDNEATSTSAVRSKLSGAAKASYPAPSGSRDSIDGNSSRDSVFQSDEANGVSSELSARSSRTRDQPLSSNSRTNSDEYHESGSSKKSFETVRLKSQSQDSRLNSNPEPAGAREGSPKPRPVLEPSSQLNIDARRRLQPTQGEGRSEAQRIPRTDFIENSRKSVLENPRQSVETAQIKGLGTHAVWERPGGDSQTQARRSGKSDSHSAGIERSDSRYETRSSHSRAGQARPVEARLGEARAGSEQAENSGDIRRTRGSIPGRDGRDRVDEVGAQRLQRQLDGLEARHAASKDPRRESAGARRRPSEDDKFSVYDAESVTSQMDYDHLFHQANRGVNGVAGGGGGYPPALDGGYASRSTRPTVQPPQGARDRPGAGGDHSASRSAPYTKFQVPTTPMGPIPTVQLITSPDGPGLNLDSIHKEWERRGSKSSNRSHNSNRSSGTKFLGVTTESAWTKWSRDRRASYRRRIEKMERIGAGTDTAEPDTEVVRVSTPIKKARQEGLKFVHPDLEARYLSEDDLKELRRHKQQQVHAMRVIERSRKNKFRLKAQVKLTAEQWHTLQEFWEHFLFVRARFFGLFVSLLALIFMAISITSPLWISRNAWNLTIVEGLWLNCSHSDVIANAVDECKLITGRDWQNVVIGLMIFAATFGLLAAVLSICGVCTNPLPRKIYYFHSAGEIFLISALSASVALLVFPIAVETDSSISSHHYGLGYGLGWGGALFLLAAAVCMSLDDLVRESSRAKCCRWCWKSKPNDRNQLRQV